MNTNETFDIAVIGAGPSGANFARLAASEKVKMLVIYDDSREKPCGGLLSPDAQRVLASYDATLPAEILASPQIFAVRVFDLDGAERRYARHYLNMNRVAFDAWLRSLMPKTVTTVHGRCVSVSDDGELFTLRMADGTLYKACRLVGADGASSLVRRTFFPKKKIRRFTAIQQHFAAEDANPFYSCIYDRTTTPALSWILFKDGVMTFGGAFAPHRCREMFELQKKRITEAGIVANDALAKPSITEACEVLCPTPAGICTGNSRVFLIGEAAGFISPSSFEGISYALLSGEALAHAITAKNPARTYRKKTAHLRRKILSKAIKQWILARPLLRRLILKSGIAAITPTSDTPEIQ